MKTVMYMMIIYYQQDQGKNVFVVRKESYKYEKGSFLIGKRKKQENRYDDVIKLECEQT